jgi:hypothetical protein
MEAMRGAAEVLWQVLAPIFLTAGFGYVLARKAGLRPQGLSRAAFYVFSPCLLFDKFSHTQLSASVLGQIAAFALLVMAGCGLFAWMLSRMLQFDRPLAAAFLVCAIAGNTGNYGLPASQFAFGEAALEPAIVYYAVSTLVLSTAGIYLAARGRQSVRTALRNVLRVPLAYAGILGLLVWATGVVVPIPIERATALAGEAAVPVMLVLLGVQLADVQLRNDVGRITLAAATKLIAGPVLGFVLAGPLGLTGIDRQAAILQSAMPSAVMATVLATEYDAAPEFTAGVVLVSTLGSLITVTFVLTLLQ